MLVACGAGAGMAAAYGVPLGGALFALEVLRGVLSLRLVLPALLASLIATAVSWLVLPDAPTYPIPDYPSSVSIAMWALLAGPVAGIVSVGYVRVIAWANRNKPAGWRWLLAPVLALGSLGLVSIWFPQLLGNGKNVAELVFTDQIPFALLLALLVLKPAATILCLGAVRQAGCSPLPLRWERYWAGCWAMPGRGSRPACPRESSPWWAPQPCWRPRLRDRSRRWC